MVLNSVILNPPPIGVNVLHGHKVLLTEEQLHNILKSYDKDKNGQLSRDEVKAAFDYLGSRWSSYRTKRAFKYADADNDGNINLSDSEYSDFVKYVYSCGYKVG